MASALTGDTAAGGDKFSLLGGNKLSLNTPPGNAVRVGDTVTFTASGNWATLRLQCFSAMRIVFDQTNTAPNTSFVLSSDASYGETQICDGSLYSAQGRIMGETQFIVEF
jgi:hypothetical protein